jgi:hypothetical protein
MKKGMSRCSGGDVEQVAWWLAMDWMLENASNFTGDNLSLARELRKFASRGRP